MFTVDADGSFGMCTVWEDNGACGNADVADTGGSDDLDIFDPEFVSSLPYYLFCFSSLLHYGGLQVSKVGSLYVFELFFLDFCLLLMVLLVCVQVGKTMELVAMLMLFLLVDQKVSQICVISKIVSHL